MNIEIKNESANSDVLHCELDFKFDKDDELFVFFISNELINWTLSLFREKYGLIYSADFNGSSVGFYINKEDKEKFVNIVNNLSDEISIVSKNWLERLRNKIFLDLTLSHEKGQYGQWESLLGISLQGKELEDIIATVNENIYWDEDFEGFDTMPVELEKITIS